LEVEGIKERRSLEVCRYGSDDSSNLWSTSLLLVFIFDPLMTHPFSQRGKRHTIHVSILLPHFSSMIPHVRCPDGEEDARHPLVNAEWLVEEDNSDRSRKGRESMSELEEVLGRVLFLSFLLIP